MHEREKKRNIMKRKMNVLRKRETERKIMRTRRRRKKQTMISMDF